MASNQAEFKLKYTIESDNSKAKKDVQEVDTLITKLFGKKTSSSGLQSGFKEVASEVSNIVSELTGDRLSGAASQVTSLANAFGAIPGPAGLAVGAIAGIGTAAVGAGAALFELTEKAAAYGESIYNAQVKTGLHATTLSAMQVAAKQSGVEFDQVTSSIQKFAQTVGQAAEGSDKAGKSLIALGLDPKKAADNLDESLGKVLKKIADAPTVVEKNTLAFQAFGKQGKELLPFIERFHGDLPALTEELEKMGVTIGDKDALAAHAFGEQMTLVTEQLEKTAIKIGFAFMPVFERMASGLSQFFAKNQSEITHWADVFAFGFERVVKGAEVTITALENYYRGYKAFMESIHLGFLVPRPFLADTINADYNAEYANKPHESAGFSPGLPTGGLPDVYGKNAKGGADKFKLSPMAKSIVDAANKIGISPLDLATIIGYESAGSFSTSLDNGKGHFGLIQFGKAEAAQYGASKGQSFDAQLGAVDRYLEDRFAKAGKSLSGTDLLSLYRAVLGGSPTASIKGTDANGTSPLSAVRQMLLGGGKGYTQADALNKFFGGKSSNVPSDKSGSEYARLQKQGYDEDEKAFDTAWRNKKDIQKAGLDYLTDLAEREVKMLETNGADYVTASEKAKAVERLKIQAYQDEIDSLEDLFAHTADLNKQAEIRQQIDLKTIEMQRAVIKITDDEHDSVVRLTSKYYDLADSLKSVQDATEQFIKSTNGGQPENVVGTGSQKPKGYLGRVLEALGIDGDKEAVDVAQQQIGDFVNMAVDAVNQMTNAVEQSIDAWILYGDSIGSSLKKATAAVLAQIAAQSFVKAIFETAEGIASLAVGNFPGAALHFEAAAGYGLLAAGAALGGKALAGKDQKKSGSGSSSYSYGSNNIDQNPTAYSRASKDAYISGHRQGDPHISALTAAIEKLNQKIDTAKPGDVLVAGMREKRGHTTETVIKEIGANAGYATALNRRTGMR